MDPQDGLTRSRQEAVLGWWLGRQRDLPWRRTRDPWAVLVCEVMAQQTQVARVAERWPVFLERFPTAASCAEAPVGEVVKLWTGLGYNRRAINLHRCAVEVVQRHGGALPADLPALLALPGVGPYTARAVAAFAFERDHGVVDTNTARILARWAGQRLGARAVQLAADSAVPVGEAWAWNQAMLDLGSLVCQRRAPGCGSCPVQAGCGWWTSGSRDPDPADRTAGVSTPQSRFDGSDRQGRGRLVEALRAGPVAPQRLAATMGWPEDTDRAVGVAAAVVADGLAQLSSDGAYRLP